MNITRITAFRHAYVTTDLLAFGDYDNSSDIERANALFALRTAANAWHGEILYTAEHTIEASDSFNGKILRTGVSPTKDDFNNLVEANTAPNAIHYITQHGEQVYIREDIASSSGLLDALQEYPLLDDDTNSEVEAIIQDASWSSYIYDELQPNIPEDTKEAHAKAAFWEALKSTGHYGHIENTTWTGFNIKDLLPAILKKLKEADEHKNNKEKATSADTRH